MCSSDLLGEQKINDNIRNVRGREEMGEQHLDIRKKERKKGRKEGNKEGRKGGRIPFLFIYSVLFIVS